MQMQNLCGRVFIFVYLVGGFKSVLFTFNPGFLEFPYSLVNQMCTFDPIEVKVLTEFNRYCTPQLRHWAIEVNVRMGGTTLPIMTL